MLGSWLLHLHWGCTDMCLCRPNVWPGEDLPDYKAAFQEAGRLIIAVGLLLTRQCDLYVKSKCPDFKAGKLERILKDSKNPKGRLLHYFPPPANSKSEQAWCTQHTDHGSLTGTDILCSILTIAWESFLVQFDASEKCLHRCIDE